MANHDSVGRALELAVDRGVNVDVALLEHVGQHRVDQRPDGVQRTWLRRDRRTPLVLGDLERRSRRGRRLGGVDETLIGHQREHEVAALLSALRIASRRIGRWRLRQRGEQRAFRQRELVDALAEQIETRRLDPVHTIAEVNDVEVVLEDLIFRKLAFEQSRYAELDQLSARRPA